MSIKSKIVKLIRSVVPDAPIRKSDGLINYGKDNLFPNNLIQVVTESGTATACVHKLKTFIEADGFANPALAEVKVNDEQTSDKLLAEIAYQVGLFNGFALNVLYKLDGSVGAIYLLPFDKIRKTEDNYFIYNEGLGTKQYKKADDVYYASYNPKVDAQERVEIIKNDIAEYGFQRGEILYTYSKSPYLEYYPVPDWTSGIQDVESDGALTVLDNRNITKGFRPTVIISTVGELDDTSKDENGKTDADYFDENLKEFTGEDAATILHLQAESKEGLPQVNMYPLAEMLDGVNGATDRISRKVCRHFGVPPVLVGLTMPEGLGNTQAMANAMKLFNHSIVPYQNMISQTFEILFPEYDWSITTLNIIDFVPPEVLSSLTTTEVRAIGGFEALSSDNNILAEQLGATNLSNVLSIVANTTLTPLQRIESLQVLFGITKQDAERLVLGKVQEVETEFTQQEQQLLQYFERSDVGISMDGMELEMVDEKGIQIYNCTNKIVAQIDPNTPFFFYDGPLDDKTRPFCRALLTLNKLFEQSDIDRLSLLVGYNVDLYFGGFNCRHSWKRARIKGKLQEGFEPTTPTGGDLRRTSVEQSDTMQEYFPL